MGRAQERHGAGVVVVVNDANQGDDVGTGGQRPVEEGLAEAAHAIAEPLGGEASAGAFGDRWEIEQAQRQIRVAAGGVSQEDALPAPDIHQAGPTGERQRIEHVRRDQRLGGCHQPAIGGHRFRVDRRGASPIGIGPVAGEPSRSGLAAQQRDRVGQIGVEHGVMLDHQGDRRVADQRRPEIGEREPTVRQSPDQVQRGGGSQKGQASVRRQAETAGDGLGRERAVAQQSEQVEPDAGEQYLRVDEAGAEIEQGPCVAPRDPAGERKPGRPALEAGGRHKPVAQGEPALAPAGMPRRRSNLRHRSRRHRGVTPLRAARQVETGASAPRSRRASQPVPNNPGSPPPPPVSAA